MAPVPGSILDPTVLLHLTARQRLIRCTLRDPMIDFADDDAHDDALTRFAILESVFFLLREIWEEEEG